MQDSKKIQQFNERLVGSGFLLLETPKRISVCNEDGDFLTSVADLDSAKIEIARRQAESRLAELSQSGK
jgi:hypothetical protein